MPVTPKSFATTVIDRISRYGIAAAIATAAMIYLPAMFVLPFSDDWAMSAWAEQHGLNTFFDAANFRFSSRLIFAFLHPMLAEQVALGVVPISIAGLLATGWLLAGASRRVSPGHAWAPVCVAVVFLFHPANTTAVIQVDTVGQVLADLLMVLCVVHVVFRIDTHGLRSVLIVSGLAFLTLLNKETALGVLAWAPAARLLRARYLVGRTLQDAGREALLIATGIAISIVLFFLLRAWAGTPMTPSSAGRYSIHTDALVVMTNSMQLLAAALYYGDVATLYVHQVSPKVVIGTAFSFLLLAVVLIEISPRRVISQSSRHALTDSRDLYVWLSFVPASLAPMVLMGSVSDLYVAGVTPFYALVLGVSLARAFAPGRSLFMILAFTALWGTACILEKQAMRQRASERTWAHVHVLGDLLDRCDLPRRRIMVEGNLADTTTGGRQYSSYSVTNERILRNVLGAYVDPYRKRWVFDKENVPSPLPVSNSPACSIAQMDQESCLLRCETALKAQSRIIRCEPLREVCADTRV